MQEPQSRPWRRITGRWRQLLAGLMGGAGLAQAAPATPDEPPPSADAVASAPARPAGAASAAATDTASGVAAPRKLLYKTVGANKGLSLYLLRPRATASPAPLLPCAVLFHGGGWRKGNARQLGRYGEALAQRGIIAISVEYRLMKDGEQIPRGAIEDARSALRWVRAHAAELGCHPQRIAAGGTSAGGHLAAMTAVKSPYDDPRDDLRLSPRPDALVLMNAPVDFDDYEAEMPIEERRKLAPLHLMDASLPPTILFGGTADRTVPIKQAYAFRDKAASLGVRDVTVVPFAGRSHGFLRKGGSKSGNKQMAEHADADFESTLDQIVDFMRRLGWV